MLAPMIMLLALVSWVFGELDSGGHKTKIRVGVFVVNPFSGYSQAEDTWSGCDIELIRMLKTIR